MTPAGLGWERSRRRLAPFRESPPQLQEGRKAVLTVHCGPEVFLDLGRHSLSPTSGFCDVIPEA